MASQGQMGVQVDYIGDKFVHVHQNSEHEGYYILDPTCDLPIPKAPVGINKNEYVARRAKEKTKTIMLTLQEECVPRGSFKNRFQVLSRSYSSVKEDVPETSIMGQYTKC